MNHATFEDLPDVSQPLDVLVVAPHPDDAELGMGGSIRKLIEQGKRVGVVDLTNGEPTPHGSIETRRSETSIASQALGLTWRYNLGMRNRFLEPTLENRHRLAGLFRLTRPKWIFAPYWIDAHPDHCAATELVEAARFWAKLSKSDLAGTPYHPERIYYYFCIHLKQVPQPAFIIDITEQWPAKAASIDAFQSQFVTGRPTEPPTFLEKLREEAAFWGKAIGVRYGEPFASKEPIGMKQFDSLI
jgi:bacillithiol biosynthesis deacetylase BshB1